MLFGICPHRSHMPKFWYTYVMMYSDFMVIVKPCLTHLFKKIKHWNLDIVGY